MRGAIFSAVLALAACSSGTQATAQPRDEYAGTWAFQTDLYGSMSVGAYMSGVAVVTPSAPGRYNIRLLAHERLVNRLSGETRLLAARQTCTGEATGEQFNISCQLAEPLEGYEPDNFVLQDGEEDQLVGVLSSAANAQVTFTRMR